jgi:hypothetical protein
VVDWDLDAPGLDRYLHPFLSESRLRSTPGVIELVSRSAQAALAAKDTGMDNGITLNDCLVRVDWAFPESVAAPTRPVPDTRTPWPRCATASAASTPGCRPCRGGHSAVSTWSRTRSSRDRPMLCDRCQRRIPRTRLTMRHRLRGILGLLSGSRVEMGGDGGQPRRSTT